MFDSFVLPVLELLFYDFRTYVLRLRVHVLERMCYTHVMDRCPMHAPCLPRCAVRGVRCLPCYVGAGMRYALCVHSSGPALPRCHA